jgi:carbon-monoxide dehydrogenase iron sulfur subunit
MSTERSGNGGDLPAPWARERLHVFADRCTGCRACEVACVAQHEGVFGRAAARIKVVKKEPIGLDYPNVCRLCVHPPCVEACPVEALGREEADQLHPADCDSPPIGAVILSEEKCIGCGACVEACPFGAADLHPQTGLALICDLCGGDPACVKRCATGAIIYGESGLQARQRREEGAMRACGSPLARWGRYGAAQRMQSIRRTQSIRLDFGGRGLEWPVDRDERPQGGAG